jgi:hypothetical protein
MKLKHLCVTNRPRKNIQITFFAASLTLGRKKKFRSHSQINHENYAPASQPRRPNFHALLQYPGVFNLEEILEPFQNKKNLGIEQKRKKLSMYQCY